MASRKKKVKLTKSDISVSSKNISHSISKIKANECKYTTIFVFIFLCLFAVVGYFALSIDSTRLLNGIKGVSDSAGISSSSTAISLSSDNIMSDEEGLKSNPHIVKLNNYFQYSYDYQLKLDEDKLIRDLCECDKTIDKSFIKYSLDGENVNTLGEDMILSKGTLEGVSDAVLSIRIWVSNESNIDDNTHFHGIFNFSEINLLESN